MSTFRTRLAGMLKRAWLTFSVIWTVVWLWNPIGPSNYRMTFADLILITLPWFLGPIIFYAFRFVTSGRFTRQRSRRW